MTCHENIYRGNTVPSLADIHAELCFLHGLAVSLSTLDYHEISPDNGGNRRVLIGITTLIDEIESRSEALCRAVEEHHFQAHGEIL